MTDEEVKWFKYYRMNPDKLIGEKLSVWQKLHLKFKGVIWYIPGRSNGKSYTDYERLAEYLEFKNGSTIKILKSKNSARGKIK